MKPNVKPNVESVIIDWLTVVDNKHCLIESHHLQIWDLLPFSDPRFLESAGVFGGGCLLPVGLGPVMSSLCSVVHQTRFTRFTRYYENPIVSLSTIKPKRLCPQLLVLAPDLGIQLQI